MRTRRTCLTIALLALAAPACAQAGLGDLDQSFASGGVSINDIGGEDSARAVAFDAADGVIAAGSSGLGDPARPGGTQLTIMRLLPNGQRDPLFGGDGIVQTDPGRYSAAFEWISMDAQARIVAVGTATGFDGAGSNLIVARYLYDGTPDPSFGTDGLVTLGGARLWFGVDGVVDGDGDLVVLAMTDGAGGERPTLLRLRDDGSLDPAFGAGGQRRLVTSKLESATSMVRSGGDVLVAGTSSDDTMAVTRIGADGSTDGDWGKAGYAQIPFPGDADATAIDLDDRNHAIVAGSCSCTRGASAAIARLGRNGRPDPHFDEDGRRTVRLGGSKTTSAAVALTTIAGRKIRLGVEISKGTQRRSAIVALTRKGEIDRKFSGDGVTSPGYGAGFGGDVLGDIVSESSGRVLAADTLFGATPEFVVARFRR